MGRPSVSVALDGSAGQKETIVRSSVLTAVLTLVMAVPAFAQLAPAYDVSVGYSLLRDEELADLDLTETLHGWLASVGFNFNRWFGVVGEIGGNYGTIDFEPPPEFPVGPIELDLKVLSFMGGPRFASHASPSFTPYGQFLFGVARGTVEVLDESESSSEFAIQPGGGIDIWMIPDIGIRVGADYRRIFIDDIEDGGGSNEFRFHVGIVIRGGSRR
jgi:Outer membrane protein beta-barrel domain